MRLHGAVVWSNGLEVKRRGTETVNAAAMVKSRNGNGVNGKV